MARLTWGIDLMVECVQFVEEQFQALREIRPMNG
jgi:hypothetical protein